ncbi:hypothetical protein ADT25_12680 [Xanthomonas oryzae]|uniref:Uncharacterized protein n=1 Tax=Xanthomonas oryzae TaxID=347 RepID=A0AAP0ZK61_9XANT|nr:hypothetical protein ADT25_12680 [Xanthomonas oryzae]QBG86057.1 hypothetical protein EYR27_22765 [Xanthomonas oryzae]
MDVAAGQAKRLVAGLNTSVDDDLRWLPDGSGLLLQQVAGQGVPPTRDATPAGPAIQQTSAAAGVRSLPTYQDLLRNEADARVFEYYAAGQPIIVGVNGQVRPIAAPGIYLKLSVSPDGRYILSERSERPFSYLVPVNHFPRRIEVLDLQGKRVRQIAQLPLVEGLPAGNDAVPPGVRDIVWRHDAPATLVWAQAQDGGDPARDSKVRDAVRMQAAPFTRAPVTLAQLGRRFESIQWGRGDLAILSGGWWKTRRIKQWRIAPDQPQRAPELLWDRCSQDRYTDPGTPATVADGKGRPLLQTSSDGNRLFLLGQGASPTIMQMLAESEQWLKSDVGDPAQAAVPAKH